MSRVVVGRPECFGVVLLSVYVIEPSTADSPSDYAIQPFVLRMAIVRIRRICHEIVIIDILRDKILAHKDYDQQKGELIDRLTDYVFEHHFVYNVVISAMGSPFE